MGFFVTILVGFAIGYAFCFMQRGKREERLHDSWRQRLTQAETQARALRDDLKAAREAGAGGPQGGGAAIDELRQKLMACESERARALAEVDRLKGAGAAARAPAAPSARLLESEAAARAAATGIPAADADAAPDDLTRIKGVGPKLAGLLNELGVFTFAQVAAWTQADIDRVDERLGSFKGRIRRDDWVAQAKTLAKG
ncbi:helix-hairpin-helix domain-containing protein [Futiania mangrovi]|uniref:Helix-hairpin-helix domain-containing protein n=1 Tax=Futiania mangrovi TaxID=2959716 RepID=A0A9J6PBP5_9PROT|nr:helix-hairpin-helix domain-containing protein [Futiania mangrovii]MCP1335921.1 helix-hairpin-helix domain-containing protein [Futiania mangrovii]